MALMGDNFNIADGPRGSCVAGVGSIPFIALYVTYFSLRWPEPRVTDHLQSC